jgi:hypothetical protein
LTVAETPGAFGHQHGDPRTLAERIEAQLRARIAEAAEMASLDLLVALRAKAGRPAPEDGNERDLADLSALALEFLAHLRATLAATLAEADRAALEAAERGAADSRARALAGHALLARRRADYWQGFEAGRQAFGEARLASVSEDKGWLKRIFGS